MTYITEKSEFAGDDVPLLDTSTPVKGYDGVSIGPANEQAQVLANRTLWLKEKGEETDQAVSDVADATEKLKLGQSSLDKRLTQVSSDVSSQGETIKSQGKTLTQLSDNVTAQKKQIKELDKRESDDFQSLVIGLGQATTDIAANGGAIKNLESGVEDLNNATLKLEDNLDQVQTSVDTLSKNVTTVQKDVASVKTKVDEHDSTLTEQRKDIDSLNRSKQDNLESGKNVNTVLGVSLVDVRSGGITLSDANDFADVLQKRLSVGKGLTLEKDGDDSLMLNVVKEENLGSNLNIRTQTGAKAYTDYELKTKQRPNYNLRAFAFKATGIKAQPNLTVNFTTDPNSSLASGYTGGNSDRINFIPDTTTSRWSTLKTLTIPQSTNLPDTRIAFSVDGTNWATYSVENSEWVDLGNLKVDNPSATVLVKQGLTLKDFNTLDISFLADWLKDKEDTPDLNLAFAATVSDIDQKWTPDKMNVTFNAANGWIIQSPYFVHVSITDDSIIFTPQQSGDYIFCFEFQK